MSNDLNSHTWEGFIASPLSPSDHQRFQDRLNAIVGIEDDGTERWKLWWGPDRKSWVWNRYTNRWEPRPQHYWGTAETTYERQNDRKAKTRLRSRRRNGLSAITLEEPIAVPRLWIGGLLPAAHRDAEFDKAGKDKDGTPYSAQRYRGPYYTLLMTITQHSILRDPDSGHPTCCMRRLQEWGVTCKGNYRPPDEEDIKHLQEMFSMKLASGLVMPDQKLDQHSKNILWRMSRIEIEGEINRRKMIQQDVAREYSLLELMKFHNRDNAGTRKGKFSIPGL